MELPKVCSPRTNTLQLGPDLLKLTELCPRPLPTQSQTTARSTPPIASHPSTVLTEVMKTIAQPMSQRRVPKLVRGEEDARRLEGKAILHSQRMAPSQGGMQFSPAGAVFSGFRWCLCRGSLQTTPRGARQNLKSRLMLGCFRRSTLKYVCLILLTLATLYHPATSQALSWGLFNTSSVDLLDPSVQTLDQETIKPENILLLACLANSVDSSTVKSGVDPSASHSQKPFGIKKAVLVVCPGRNLHPKSCGS